MGSNNKGITWTFSLVFFLTVFYNDNNLTFVLCMYPFGDADMPIKVYEKNKKC